ncbi:MAG: hypothetical protein AAF587_02250 [Bacteroidota bacterium]
MIIRTSLILVLLALLSSCQISNQLRVHKTELQRLAYNEPENRAKFDGLAKVLVTALEEASARPTTTQTVRYVQKFSNQNDRSLRQLSTDLDAWIKGMGPGQRLAFGTRALSQSYSRKLIVLVPKIQKKAKEGGFELGALEKVLLLFKLKQLTKKSKKD